MANTVTVAKVFVTAAVHVRFVKRFLETIDVCSDSPGFHVEEADQFGLGVCDVGTPRCSASWLSFGSASTVLVIRTSSVRN